MHGFKPFPRGLALAVVTLAASWAASGCAPAVVAAPQGAPAQGTLPAAERVVERYVQAVGGRQAILAQQFRTTKSEMTIPGMPGTATVEGRQARQGNRFLMRVSIPNVGVFDTGHDGQVAWSSNPSQGAKLLRGRELSDAMRQYDFDANLLFAHIYPRMETVARAQVGGEACVQVRMVTAAGDEALSCFSEASGLLLGSTVRADAGSGVRESTLTFGDYREFGGMKVPTMHTITTGRQQIRVRVLSVTTEPIDASVFTAPPAVRAPAR